MSNSTIPDLDHDLDVLNRQCPDDPKLKGLLKNLRNNGLRSGLKSLYESIEGLMLKRGIPCHAGANNLMADFARDVLRGMKGISKEEESYNSFARCVRLLLEKTIYHDLLATYA